MSDPSVGRAFIVLHITLGLGILAATLQTLVHMMREHGGPGAHLGLVIALEGIGALLFLIPRTLRGGAVLLLCVLLGGFVVHLTRGELEVQLAIYAAGVWFVMSHGAEWRGPVPPPARSA